MKKIIYVFCVGLLLVSCSSTMYIPESVQVSSLTEKNEVEISATLGSSGIDVGGAYALTDHIGVQAKASVFHIGGEDGEFNHRYFGDFGLGYTSFIGEEDSRLVLSGFAGAGMGSIDLRQTYTTLFGNSYTDFGNGKYYKVWLQPSLAMDLNLVEMIFATRISFVEFTEMSAYFPYNVDGLDLLHGKLTNVYYEPVVTFRFGTPKVKGTWQLGWTFAQNPFSEMRYRQSMLISNAGIVLTL